MATRRLTYIDLLDPPQNATIILVRCGIINSAGRELLWRSTTLLKARWYEIVITLALLNLKLEEIAEVRASPRLRLWVLLEGKDQNSLLGLLIQLETLVEIMTVTSRNFRAKRD
jgi:hypothetical protein